MAERADVVIVGAGVNGASLAFHLTALGVRDVLVIEQRYVAAGATGKSGALVRMHYTNPHETALALASLRQFQAWPDLVGTPSPLVSTGFVQLVPRSYADDLRSTVAMLRDVGVDTVLLTADELRELEPAIALDDDPAIAYEPESGYADPYATAWGFLTRAQERGARLWEGVTVLGVRHHGDRVLGVETTRGPVDAPIVVLAPGAWANRLLQPLGIDLGLEPHRVQVVLFRWPGTFHQRLTYIDAGLNLWFRPEGTNLTLSGVEVAVRNADPDTYQETGDAEFVNPTRQTLARRFPALAAAPLRGSWAGIIMMSPDGHPIIDQLPGYQGLFAILGDSGTSFKTAPAIGRCLAEWIVEGQPRTVDLTPFSARRLLEGRPWRDPTNYGRVRPTISR